MYKTIYSSDSNFKPLSFVVLLFFPSFRFFILLFCFCNLFSLIPSRFVPFHFMWLSYSAIDVVFSIFFLFFSQKNSLSACYYFYFFKKMKWKKNNSINSFLKNTRLSQIHANIFIARFFSVLFLSLVVVLVLVRKSWLSWIVFVRWCKFFFVHFSFMPFVDWWVWVASAADVAIFNVTDVTHIHFGRNCTYKNAAIQESGYHYLLNFLSWRVFHFFHNFLFIQLFLVFFLHFFGTIEAIKTTRDSLFVCLRKKHNFFASLSFCCYSHAYFILKWFFFSFSV